MSEGDAEKGGELHGLSVFISCFRGKPEIAGARSIREFDPGPNFGFEFSGLASIPLRAGDFKAAGRLTFEMHVQPVVSSIVSRTATTAALPVHHSLVPHWIVHLGLLGFFLVAVLDSSVIPLPIPGSTDLLLLWMVSQRGNPWLLASTAVVGSLVGGYTTWHLGRRGGEAALHRYVSARLLQPVTGWVQNHPILAVFLPAMLPPADSAVALCLGLGCTGGAAAAFFAGVWRGAVPTLWADYLAGHSVWPPCCAAVVGHAAEVVGTAAVDIRHRGSLQHLVWNMEDVEGRQTEIQTKTNSRGHGGPR